MIPAMPAPRPVAFDEQLELGIASVMCVEKFVQPLNWRYDWRSGVMGKSGPPGGPSVVYLRTEFTTIVCA